MQEPPVMLRRWATGPTAASHRGCEPHNCRCEPEVVSCCVRFFSCVCTCGSLREKSINGHGQPRVRGAPSLRKPGCHTISPSTRLSITPCADATMHALSTAPRQPAARASSANQRQAVPFPAMRAACHRRPKASKYVRRSKLIHDHFANRRTYTYVLVAGNREIEIDRDG